MIIHAILAVSKEVRGATYSNVSSWPMVSVGR